MLAKNSTGKGKSSVDRPRLANTKLVCNGKRKRTSGSKVQTKIGECVYSKSHGIKKQLRQRANFSLPLLKQHFDQLQLPNPTRNLFVHSWKEGTQKTYKNYIDQWIMYCSFHKLDPHVPSVVHVTTFLRLLLADGASYSTVNVARCALSAVLYTGPDSTIGTDRTVSRVVKGCGNLNPPEPRYDSTWDVSKVFKTLETWGKNDDLSLLKLSKKTVMLLLLCTAHRGQTI